MKKLLTCCYILLLPVSFLIAQQRQIDSLKSLVNTDRDDSLKILHLNKLSTAYCDQGEMHKALDCGKSALTLSQRTNNIAGQAKAVSSIGLAYYLQADYTTALSYYSKSLAITESMGNKSGAASITSSMGLIYDA